jgi:hypothetical protein
MATVLSFNAATRRGERAANPPTAHDAEIVIFPGVRIERHEADYVGDDLGELIVAPVDPGDDTSWPRRTS